jgi:DnaJ like chaperone protein
MDNPETARTKKTAPFSFAGYFAGPLLGMVVGSAVGKGGSLIGALLGALLQQLIRRHRSNRKVARYFEAPGKVDFTEGLPGLSAYCALGIVLVSLSVRAANPNPLFPGQGAGEGSGTVRSKKQDGELIAKRVIHSALEAFPGSSSALALMEGFCRIALSMTDRLNPDLLAESLAARRYGAGDLERLGRELEALAEGDRALREAASIRRILEPFSRKTL